MNEIEEMEGAAEVTEGIKKGNRIAGIIVAVFFVLVGVGLGVRGWLGREEVKRSREGVVYIGRDEASVVEEYVEKVFLMQELVREEFREMESGEIVERLGELKEGFSGVARKVEKLDGAEILGVREIILSDTAQYLAEIRSLRAAEAREEMSEADKQAEFIKISGESKEKFRSAVYVAEYAFRGDEEGLMTKSGVVAEGKMLVEVGGGVMNVFVGEGAVGVSSDDYVERVKTIRGEHEFIINQGGEMVRIGTGVREEMELGKGVGIRLVCETEGCEKGAEVERRKIGMFGKTTIEVGEQFLHTGAKGFVKNSE